MSRILAHSGDAGELQKRKNHQLHQQVMNTGRGDGQRPLGRFLPADVARHAKILGWAGRVGVNREGQDATESKPARVPSELCSQTTAIGSERWRTAPNGHGTDYREFPSRRIYTDAHGWYKSACGSGRRGFESPHPPSSQPRVLESIRLLHWAREVRKYVAVQGSDGGFPIPR